MWLRKESDNDIKYLSINKLQLQAKQERDKLGLNCPIIHNMEKCFNCNRLFNHNDVFTFYSDEYDEYCKHEKCPVYRYSFQVTGLQQGDLQLGIFNGNIDYEGATIIPRDIKRMYLDNYIKQDLDLSKTELNEIDVANYRSLDLDAFKSVKKLICNNTMIDFTKFINLTKLNMTNVKYPVDLSPCKSLIDVTLENISNIITIDGCDKLKTLILINIDTKVIIHCPNLQRLELHNVQSCIDLSNCDNLSELKIINGPCNLTPYVLPNITFLYVNNNTCDIDLQQFPNITSLVHIISNKPDYKTLHIDKLNNLKVYQFHINFMNNKTYDFDFSLNHKLEKISIYSYSCKCNVIFGDNLKLKECNLEFKTDNPINIPKNVSIKKIRTIY
jgi:hypothetical protein